MAQLAGPRRPARTPPEPAGGSQARHAGAWYCTTRVENAHGTGVREVLYRWHPWFGLAVHVHAAATKADGVYFRCTLNGADGARWQELPAWMFDRAACAGSCMLLAEPLVSMAAPLEEGDVAECALPRHPFASEQINDRSGRGVRARPSPQIGPARQGNAGGREPARVPAGPELFHRLS